MKSKKEKRFKIDSIPAEVQKVWVVEMYCKNYRTGVGSELLQECREIMKKYPQYFPKEKVISK